MAGTKGTRRTRAKRVASDQKANVSGRKHSFKVNDVVYNVADPCIEYVVVGFYGPNIVHITNEDVLGDITAFGNASFLRKVSKLSRILE